MSSKTPDEDQGVWHDEAIIVPPYQHRRIGRTLAVGVLDKSGVPVTGSQVSVNKFNNRGYHPAPQSYEGDIVRREGKWLFAGFFQPHIGHQITQCLGRLPGLADAGEIDGVIFAGGPRAQRQARKQAHFKELLRIMGADLPIEVAVQPTQVETLYVAPERFGEVGRCVPEDRFKTWIGAALDPIRQAPEPGKRIYVSRSRIHSLLGRILCENILERNFRQAGYEIYYPEEHSIEDQLRTYMQAEVIIATDGTAAHLIAFAQQPGQTLVFLARRRQEPELIINHLRGFQPDPGSGLLNFVDCIAREWHSPLNGKLRPRAEIDFDRLYNRLNALGVLDGASERDWKEPEPAELEASKSAGCTAGEELAVLA